MTPIKPEFRERPACAEKYAPLPECAPCPHCGCDIEIWSDEESASCSFCGLSIRRQPDT